MASYAKNSYDYRMGKKEMIRRIEAEMRKKGLDNKALAKAVGVSGATISRYRSENRAPSAAILASIANALDVSVSYLQGETDIPERADAPPLPEYAVTIIERMRELDEVQNYTLRLIADTLFEHQQELRHQSLLFVINWISEVHELDEEGEALQASLRRFEARFAKLLPGQTGDQPSEQD